MPGAPCDALGPRSGAAGRQRRSETGVADARAGWHDPSCHGETVAAETTGGGYQNMRKYEMVVTLDPSVDERTVTGTFEKLVQVIPTEGGTIDDVDIWGEQKFAYQIDKKTEGIDIDLSFTTNAS